MVRAKFGLEYLHRPTKERLGLVILSLGLKQTGEVVVADCNGGMILAESLFTDLDGPTKERLGPGLNSLGLKQNSDVLRVPRKVGMILSANLFIDLDGPTTTPPSPAPHPLRPP